MGDLALVAANGLLGGLTAGGRAALRGDSFSEALGPGFLGGTVVYAGKRVAAARVSGAGFVGREIAALGASVVRNASEGREALASLAFPLGPLTLHLRTGSDPAVRPRLSLGAAYWTAYGLTHPELHLDAPASLSAGTPVFDADHGFFEFQPGSPDGAAAGGVVFLAHSPVDHQSVFAHERIHVLQTDYFIHTWSRPAEEWLARRTRLPGFLYRYVDFDLLLPLLRGGLDLADVDPVGEPFEFEADFLMDVRR